MSKTTGIFTSQTIELFATTHPSKLVQGPVGFSRDDTATAKREQLENSYRLAPVLLQPALKGSAFGLLSAVG